MAKPLINIFPKLRGKMAEHKDNVNDLVDCLGISDDSVRRRLKGEKDFELSEIIILADRYSTSIDELFESEG
jgi:hypothetical protein